MNDSNPHRLIVLGLRCPVPVLMAARAIAELQSGDRLEVLGDDPEMLRDFPAWCDEGGHRLLTLDRDGGAIRAVIEKGSLGAPQS
jgi:tRNA 2-thiouridine synthesizing protein A